MRDFIDVVVFHLNFGLFRAEDAVLLAHVLNGGFIVSNDSHFLVALAVALWPLVVLELSDELFVFPRDDS